MIVFSITKDCENVYGAFFFKLSKKFQINF